MDFGEFLGPSHPVLHTVIRGTVTYLALFALLRIAGRRESGSIALTDLLVVVLVAQASSHGLVGEANGIIDGLILVVTILAWSVALDALAWRFRPLRKLLKPSAVPVIVDGEVNEKVLRREFMLREELREELRLHGVEEFSEVRRAYIEGNGRISVFKRDE